MYYNRNNLNLKGVNSMKKEIFNFLITIMGLIGFYCLCYFKWLEALICIGCIIIIYCINNRLNVKKDPFSPSIQGTQKYIRKDFMTASELSFYNKLKTLEEQYIIIPQLNLASIIHKIGTKYCTDLFRNIDFAIFSKKYELLLLIELNDSSHNEAKRKARDIKVKKILNECNIPLLTFYTHYSNENNDVLNRIIKALDNLNDTKSRNN